jgi:GTP cyclohydrolase II
MQSMQFVKSIITLASTYRSQVNRPFVTLSYAQSLDGCISAKPGEALLLSGRESLMLTHQLRATHDAILVGIGTVLSDNPRLTVRLVRGEDPVPVVVDSRLRLPLDCNLLNQDSKSPIIITTKHAEQKKKAALKDAGARVVTIPCTPGGRVDLTKMLEKLAELGINSVMVEGGSGIITNFLFERLVNYIVLTVAPVLVGGLKAVSDFAQLGENELPRLSDPGHQWLGEDLILWGHVT